MTVARRLMRRKGVVGVFWGGKHGAADRTGRVRVHVREKIDRAQLPPHRVIAKQIEGLRTCVVGVGDPRGHDLTLKELVTPVGARRFSALTMMAEHDGRWLALLSAHATLPMRQGALVTSYDAGRDPDVLDLEDVSSGTKMKGALISGRIGPSADFAVAVVDVPDVPIRLKLAVATGYPPALRSTALHRGETLHQYSCRDRARRDGRLIGQGIVDVRFRDDRTYTFPRVLAVEGDGGPFSVPGDSGSLVADDDGLAIGVVLAGSEDHPGVSYVLPLRTTDIVPIPLRPFFR